MENDNPQNSEQSSTPRGENQIIKDMENILTEALDVNYAEDLEDSIIEMESVKHAQSVLFDISASIPNVFDDVEGVMQEYSDKDPVEIAIFITQLTIDKADSLSAVETALYNRLAEKLILIGDIATATDEDLKGLELPKREIQISVIESNSYSPEEKELILLFVDEYLDGEGLDSSDPDMVLQTMSDQKSRTEQNELSHAKSTEVIASVRKELEKYNAQKDDPEYQHLVLLLSIYADGDMGDSDLSELVAIQSDVLGISRDDLLHAIKNIRDRT